MGTFRRARRRSFEDQLRRVLRPGEALKRAQTLSRPIDGHGKPKKGAKTPPVPLEYKQLAARIGMKPDTFHNKIDGASGFWASEAREVLAHVHDIELADWFLEGTPWVAAHRLEALSLYPGLLENLVQNALVHWCDLTGLVDRAVADDTVTHDEKDSIYRKIVELETAVAALRKLVEPVDAPPPKPARDTDHSP